jgi:DNA-binding CsgD family transcriptional regulator
MASVLGGLVEHPEDPEPVRATLRAWQVVESGALSGALSGAAASWTGSALREQVRCLLAAGLTAADPTQGIPPLLQAEAEADRSGLVVLLGRVRRGLRRFAVSRDDRTAGSDTATAPSQRGPRLSQREMQVLVLVAEGEPTRRIAGLLGISRETVETHVRAGMRKLGARTRTEAAALAAALPAAVGNEPS